jgi:hypothetical protein
MSHQLTVEVADDVYQPLLEQAQAVGQSPEALASKLIASGVVRTKAGASIRKWIGAFESDVPDAAERHDYYIGQALFEELKGRRDE